MKLVNSDNHKIIVGQHEARFESFANFQSFEIHFSIKNMLGKNELKLVEFNVIVGGG